MIPVEDLQPGQSPHAWPVEHGIRVANGLHDIADIRQGGNERPIELARRQEEYALPWAPVPARGFHQHPAHDRPDPVYVAPGWPAGQGPHAGQVHLVDQHFEPAAFLLEFQGAIRDLVARGVETRPTPAHRFEVKERFTGLSRMGLASRRYLSSTSSPSCANLLRTKCSGCRSTKCLRRASSSNLLCAPRWQLSTLPCSRLVGSVGCWMVSRSCWRFKIWWTPTATPDQLLP